MVGLLVWRTLCLVFVVVLGSSVAIVVPTRITDAPRRAELVQGFDSLKYNAPADLTGIGILGLVTGSAAVAAIAFVSAEIRVLRFGRPARPRTEAGRLAEDDAKEEAE